MWKSIMFLVGEITLLTVKGMRPLVSHLQYMSEPITAYQKPFHNAFGDDKPEKKSFTVRYPDISSCGSGEKT